jgi:hypothetical protein
MNTRSPLGLAAMVGLVLVLAGCNQLRGMQQVSATGVNVKPPADQAAVVFLRAAPSGTTTSLFDLRDPPENKFIGLLVADTRMVYLTAPGRTRFMVIGLSASFLDAELEAGKTYQVAIVFGSSPEEQFRMVPVRPGQAPSKVVQNCLESCLWVENTDRSVAWARGQASSIQRKKAHYLPLWESRPNRPVLLASDGR